MAGPSITFKILIYSDSTGRNVTALEGNRNTLAHKNFRKYPEEVIRDQTDKIFMVENSAKPGYPLSLRKKLIGKAHSDVPFRL